MSHRLKYIMIRSANAARMVRRGELLRLARVILAEVRHRFRTVPGSSYVDLTRLKPASPRPTQSGMVAPFSLRADRRLVAEEIQRICASIDLDEEVES